MAGIKFFLHYWDYLTGIVLAHWWHSEAVEMATIRKRHRRYHVQVRKHGYPAVTQTFSSIVGSE